MVGSDVERGVSEQLPTRKLGLAIGKTSAQIVCLLTTFPRYCFVPARNKEEDIKTG